MKKSLILAGMLAVGYANAQEGKVGINTETPKATLEVLPNVKNAEATATTNEGIVAPKLSKTRIANIAEANLVEGTLVYATDATYTGNNTKVAKITEKGYYFYDGTEWVKAGAGAEDTSIYTTNGTLSGHRTVDMANRNLLFTNNGRIGIGTTSPSSALTIEGTGGGWSDDISINTYNSANTNAFSLISNRHRGTADAKEAVQAKDLLGNIMFRAYNGTQIVNGARIDAIVSEVNGTDIKSNLILTPTKNVGIGTNDPLAKLDVNGNMRVTTPGGQWLTAKTGTGGITSSTKLTNIYHPFLRQETLNGHFANIGGIGDNFGIYAITAEQTDNATTGQLVMNTATGNVAIGQANPDANAKLVVNGDTKITGLAGTGDRPVAVAADGTLKVGTALQNLQGSTSVAITSNQIQRAALTGDVTAAANNNTVTVTKIQGKAIANTAPTNGQVLKWNGSAWAPAADTDTNTNIYTTNGTLSGHRTVTMGSNNLMFNGAGNVGIGTTAPTQKLDVNGNARVRQMPSGLEESVYTKAVVADANGNLAVVSRTNPTLPNASQTIFANRAQPTDVMLGQTFLQIQKNLSSLGHFYFRYTGQSITLPPGKWIVYCGYLIGGAGLQYYTTTDNKIARQNVWVRGIVDDNPNNVLKTSYTSAAISGSPVLISTNVMPQSNFAYATGLWFVDNTTTANKTYYLKVSFEPTGFREGDTQKITEKMSSFGEDYMIAIRRL